MNALEIEKVLATLKADKNGRIRGKNRAINAIMSLHLKSQEGKK
jgi:hypothetical protein